MYQSESRIAFKGQVFSAPMDWTSMLQQLHDMDEASVLVALPHTGATLADMVKIHISSGLVELNKHLKQVTVRRHVVVQLIRLFRDAGHSDYKHLNMREVQQKAQLLADSDDPSIPHGLEEVLDEEEDDVICREAGVDKAATPAERIRSAAELERTMERTRPNILLSQRDSDARKEVEASRASAFSSFSELDLRTGSTLLDQFQGSYIPRVFHMTLPWCVGGPDLRGRTRYRRSSEDAPALTLDEFTAMIPRRVEAQMRWDWDLVPAVWSLRFATKVNLGASLSIKRTLRAGDPENSDEQKIGHVAAKVYKLLVEGEYWRADGTRQRIDGDTSKLLSAIGLTSMQRSMVQNYYFMSTRISGTRQIRRTINHMVFSSRVKYGLPIFMTVTPSERHSGLMIRLTRYRRNDPAIRIANPEFAPWIGADAPSLEASEDVAGAGENETIELPDYDLRRLMTSKDSLCSVDAYKVYITVIVARLFGLRMCPDCPHCNKSGKPCMDMFGSNATPMGGCAGRADALIGATEAQKAEGVLHLHFFIYVQMAHQFMNLSEIADLLRDRFMTVESLKVFHDHLRCAVYPDDAKFEADRSKIEQKWPAYADDTVLSRAPAYVWDALHRPVNHLHSTDSWEVWREEGKVWLRKRAARLQHVLSHMNHHIHPLINDATEERRPLMSCRPKNRPKECKFGFPLEKEMTEKPLLICHCIAEQRGLPTTGPRSAIGSIMVSRNNPWLNAAPTGWAEFAGSNGDIKFPLRVPILPDTHEMLLFDVKRCCDKGNAMELAYQVQVSQSITAGYFGGYSAKMQDVGKRELESMHLSVSRHIQTKPEKTNIRAFVDYSKRLLRDLEGKGIVRTAVETTNLAISSNHQDVMHAECIRTFPSVTFPAVSLLRREEVETGKSEGASIIAAVGAAGGAFSRRAYVEAPFDLMYGFRGQECFVELLSPYEMLMHWVMEPVHPPVGKHKRERSEFTEEGLQYKEECARNCCVPHYEAGTHYISTPANGRLLMPSHPALGVLRHKWVWERRRRPHVPVWSFSKIPKSNISPEENARLLSVYMRPWTLNPEDSSEIVPLLANMQRVGFSHDDLAVNNSAASPKRRRLTGKTTTYEEEVKSYLLTWQRYVDGNVVTESAKRYISNLLGASAARVVTKTEDSDNESSDESDNERFKTHAGTLGLVRNTLRGIAVLDEDEGRIGFGRYASCIHMGRALWCSADLSTTERERAKERFFDDGTFPDTKEALKAAKQLVKLDDERAQPFTGKTKPYAHVTVKNYGDRIHQWLEKIAVEKEAPSEEQMNVLENIAKRVLHEFRDEKEDTGSQRKRATSTAADVEEPMRGLIHGLPGTGKSRVIKWIRRFFEECLEWKHGEQFICVAFQNRMAAAIDGVTLHAGADLQRPGENRDRKLTHSEIDNLYIQNSSLRWVLLDEISMVADNLLDEFEMQFSSAARKTRYTSRVDGSKRIFGGYNLLLFGDWWQLPPIPASAALFLPPTVGEKSKRVVDMFWGTTRDSINYLAELTVQKRIEDTWYNDVLLQCRQGQLNEEDYFFLMGLPTSHCGSWLSQREDVDECCKGECRHLHAKWRELSKGGSGWETLVALECIACRTERARRNRLVAAKDPRVREPPFVRAPFIHQNNEPKYNALLVRAVEDAKRGGVQPEHILWAIAEDTPLNPAEIAGTPEQMEKKRSKWLQYHDQTTCGLPGLLPLYYGMPARVTERISKKLRILKHCPCKVVGWVLHTSDVLEAGEHERMLHYLPVCIYVKFEDATWQVHKKLPPGVFPLRPVVRTWVVNRQTEAKIKRKGFQLLPDFACTAHMVQGMTLPGLLADIGDVLNNVALKDMLAAYVALSRVRSADTLLLLRAFSKHLFQQGPPPGPHCLMKLLRARCTSTGSEEGYNLEKAMAEYHLLVESKKDSIAARKEEGYKWQCFDCGYNYPSEAFGANSKLTEEVFAKCISPGCWIACMACTAAHASASERKGMPVELRRCELCQQTKESTYFAGDADELSWCSPCELQREYKRADCRICRKEKTLAEFPIVARRSDSEEESSLAICLECKPAMTLHRCTVCNVQKAPSDFFALPSKKNRHILRCKACHTCTGCGKVQTDLRRFMTNSRCCWSCAKSKCDVCGEHKKTTDFPFAQSKLGNAVRNETKRCSLCHFCVGCEKNTRASNFDSTSKQCRTCEIRKEELCCDVCRKWMVADDFPKDRSNRSRVLPFLRCNRCHTCQKCFRKCGRQQFDKGANICNTCVVTSTLRKCDGCKEKKMNSEFHDHSILNAANRGGYIVCKACQQRGLSRTDIQIYRCKKKGCQYGHLKFARTDAGQRVCLACEGEEKAQRKDDAQREKAIKKTLKGKDAWHCTCRKKTDPNRLLRLQWHVETCTLYSGKVGEERWAGKNKGITAEDLEFLDKRRRTT